jgi:hypothetical protein
MQFTAAMALRRWDKQKGKENKKKLGQTFSNSASLHWGIPRQCTFCSQWDLEVRMSFQYSSVKTVRVSGSDIYNYGTMEHFSTGFPHINDALAVTS